ncbi:hypothetical protein AOQ84DRAFT_406347 [Glonium stellatum]|uniref:DUF7580 domain-containing protein n=1 Tax=Glonium stellatum TaxID=574774 RepID=A0A8E2F1N3_9PEZI|nr:hypothetical protein AOQ84DRAFT_406347 [Glonium stellatum]
MSGFEVVGVVFGVLPVLIEVVKGYARLSDKIHAFRHYSREVKSVQVQLRISKLIFHNECRLLLRLVVKDDQKVKDMVEDTSDERWRSKELNDQMAHVLKDNFDLCKSIIEASQVTLELLEADLKKFDVFVEQKLKDEPLKAAIRRLRNSIKITFKKSKYEESLSNLRNQNIQLGQLRSHLRDFKDQKTCSADTCIRRRTLPSQITAVQQASHKLYEALSNAWCCGNLAHAEHYAKICLDAEVHAGVRLDLAILCHEKESDNHESAITEPPIWLYVQSTSIEATACHTVQPSSYRASDFLVGQNSSRLNCTPGGKKKTTNQESAQPKRRKVRFAGTGGEDEEIGYAGHTAEAVSTAFRGMAASYMTEEINLCQTKNICHYLKQNLHLCGSAFAKHCVGYLETPNLFKHVFCLEEKRNAIRNRPQDVACNSIFSIPDLMAQSKDDTLAVVDQLKLAHKTAIAILQFNATPWLAKAWRLEDLCYSGAHNELNEEALRTLHFSVQISNHGQKSEALPMEGVESNSSSAPTFSEDEIFGIYNPTLFGLGVALLELGHWKPLEGLSHDKDLNLILTARRLASRPTPLGPDYQEIVRKCLQCNFGFGTDLNKKRLQSAVYNDVVCQLESMIEKLSI